MKVEQIDDHNEVLSCVLVSRKDPEDHFSGQGMDSLGVEQRFMYCIVLFCIVLYYIVL